VVSVSGLVRGLRVLHAVGELGVLDRLIYVLSGEIEKCSGRSWVSMLVGSTPPVEVDFGLDDIVAEVALPEEFVKSVNECMVEEFPAKLYFLGSYNIKIHVYEDTADLWVVISDVGGGDVSEGFLISEVGVFSYGKALFVINHFFRSKGEYIVNKVERFDVGCASGSDSVGINFCVHDVVKEWCDVKYGCDDLFTKVLDVLYSKGKVFKCLYDALTKKLSDVVKAASLLSLYP